MLEGREGGRARGSLRLLFLCNSSFPNQRYSYKHYSISEKHNLELPCFCCHFGVFPSTCLLYIVAIWVCVTWVHAHNVSAHISVVLLWKWSNEKFFCNLLASLNNISWHQSVSIQMKLHQSLKRLYTMPLCGWAPICSTSVSTKDISAVF